MTLTSHMRLRPVEGSFLVESTVGGFAKSLINIQGKLQIEALDRNGIEIAGERFNIYAKMGIELFGLSISDLEAGMNWELALLARVSHSLPLLKASGELRFKPHLHDPSLNFHARVADVGDLAEIHVDVNATTGLCSVDATAKFIGAVEIGTYFQLPGLSDLTPERIAEELLRCVDFNLNIGVPRNLSFKPSNAPPPTGGEITDKGPNQAKRLGTGPSPQVDQPKAVGEWHPAWWIEIEERVTHHSTGGWFGTGLFSEDENEIERIPHYRVVEALRGIYEGDAKPLETSATYFKRTGNTLLIVDRANRLQMYEGSPGRWIKSWTGETDHHTALVVRPLFSEKGIAFFGGYGPNLTIAAAANTKIPADHSAFAPSRALDTGRLVSISEAAHPNNLTSVQIGQSGAPDVLASENPPRRPAWLLAALRLRNITAQQITDLQNDIFYVHGLKGNCVVVARQTDPFVVDDLTGSAPGKPAPQLEKNHADKIGRLAECLGNLPSLSSQSSAFSVRGELLGLGGAEWRQALLLQQESIADGPFSLVDPQTSTQQQRSMARTAGRWRVMDTRQDTSATDVLKWFITSSQFNAITNALAHYAPGTPISLAMFRTSDTEGRMAFTMQDEKGTPKIVFLDARRTFSTNDSGGYVPRHWEKPVEAVAKYWKTRPSRIPGPFLKALDRDAWTGDFVERVVQDDWQSQKGWKADPSGALSP